MLARVISHFLLGMIRVLIGLKAPLERLEVCALTRRSLPIYFMAFWVVAPVEYA